ncbi:hypothetical protein PG994_003422 [Apiospora phragmitis]|uniref:Uncharacterized protein n=1 Tax=Apiospora phragmitis TaxID=2905665 RepID=A0ABR1VY27_9PEZI
MERKTRSKFGLGGLNLNQGKPVLSQDISVCPGANYELTFTMSSQLKYTTAVTVTALGITLATIILAPPGASQGYGPYPFSVPDSADTFAYTTLHFQISTPIFYPIIYIDDVSIYQP